MPSRNELIERLEALEQQLRDLRREVIGEDATRTRATSERYDSSRHSTTSRASESCGIVRRAPLPRRATMPLR